MSNPWDVPAKPTHAPDRSDEIYAAVGRALSNWDEVELALAEIFSIFTGTPIFGDRPFEEPAIRAYGSVISFNGRTEMLEAASRGYFHNKKTPTAELEKNFRALLTECKGFAGRRNDFAHGRVEFLLSQPYLWWTGNDPCWLFLPGVLSTRKYTLDHEPLYIYTASQILHFAECFKDLAVRLHDLWREIMHIYALP